MTPASWTRTSAVRAYASPKVVCEAPCDLRPDEERWRTATAFVGHTHAPLPESWSRHLPGLRSGLAERINFKRFDAGTIDVIPDSFEDVPAMAIRLMRSFVPDYSPSGNIAYELDHQVLVCAGANFHTDHDFWPDTLFLNWYLTGPPMDFVMPESGYRQTVDKPPNKPAHCQEGNAPRAVRTARQQ